MKVITKHLDWSNHQHSFRTIIHTSDHYYEESVTYCILCNEMAIQSGIPDNRHFEHPKGCKCHWCVYCLCSKLCEREKS